MLDYKSLCQDLRPDFSAGHSAERAGIFEQAVKRERAAQRNKDGSKIDKEFCGQALELTAKFFTVVCIDVIFCVFCTHGLNHFITNRYCLIGG